MNGGRAGTLYQASSVEVFTVDAALLLAPFVCFFFFFFSLLNLLVVIVAAHVLTL